MTTDDRCKCAVYVTVHVCVRFPVIGKLFVRGAVSVFYSGRNVDFFLPLLLACTLVFRDSACLAEVEENSLGVKVSGSVSVLGPLLSGVFWLPVSVAVSFARPLSRMLACSLYWEVLPPIGSAFHRCASSTHGRGSPRPCSLPVSVAVSFTGPWPVFSPTVTLSFASVLSAA